MPTSSKWLFPSNFLIITLHAFLISPIFDIYEVSLLVLTLHTFFISPIIDIHEVSLLMKVHIFRNIVIVIGLFIPLFSLQYLYYYRHKNKEHYILNVQRLMAHYRLQTMFILNVQLK
jgi:hypothetical protein